MKIVQILNESGQINGHSKAWDSATGSVEEKVWAWPYGTTPGRVAEMLRTSGGVMGLTYHQMESDGRYYIDSAYTAVAGDSPGPITDPAVGYLTPFAQNNFMIGGTVIIALLDWRSQYVVYDFAADIPVIKIGAIGSFPASISGLTTVSYTDGATRLVAMSGDTALMYLSTPLDGSTLDLAASLPIAVPPSSPTDYADISIQTAYGATQLANIIAAGSGTPVWGDGWMVGNDPGYPGLYARSLTSQSVVAPLPGNSIRVEFVTGVDGDQAVTLIVDAAGSITEKSVVAVSGVSVSGIDKWFVMGPTGVTPPAVTPPFWRSFVKTFEQI